MIVLGIVLLLLGILLGVSLLYILGVILLVVGLVLLAAGHFGHPVGGRGHYWLQVAGDPLSVIARTVTESRELAGIFGLLSSLPLGYRREFAETSEGIYWHLFYNGERVNGGLAHSYSFAETDSYHAAHKHGNAGYLSQNAMEEPW